MRAPSSGGRLGAGNAGAHGRGLSLATGFGLACVPNRAIALVLAVATAAGCEAAPGSGGAEPAVRDSAGLTIVEIPGQPVWDQGEAWQVEPEPLVSIGQAEGEEPYLLSYVAGALRLDDGRIVVANHDAESRIRVYDAEGRHLEYWGGQGGGPGEFALPPYSLYRAPDGAIVVPEMAIRQVHRFEPDGTFRDRAVVQLERVVDPQERVALASCCQFGQVLPDGSWLLHFPQEGIIAGSGVRRGEFVLFRVSTTGEWMGIFARYPGGLWRPGGPDERAVVSLPATGYLSTAVVGDEVFMGNGAAYQVDVFDLEGTHVRSLRLDRELRPLSSEIRERWVEHRVQGIRNLMDDDEAERRRAGLEADAPERVPAFAQILPGPDDELWLVSPSIQGSPEIPRTAVILDAEHRYLGEVTLPPRMRPLQVGRDPGGDRWVLGVSEDEMGIPRVDLHRVMESGGG